MTWIQIEPPFQPLLRALGRDSFEAVMNAWAARATTKARTIVRRIPLSAPGEQLDIYFKEYRFSGPSWRFWLRPSKARVEFANYGTMAAIGLPVAQRIAGAERRDRLGRVLSAWIITRAVPESQTLLEFLASPASPAERKQVLSELAEIIARMHRERFFHYDLFGRNILVSRQPAGFRPVLIDCPRGRRHRLLPRLHSIRDLASLDKDARPLCRRTERMRFLLQYLGKQRLDAEAKQVARACLRYGRKRWGHA